MKTPYVTAPAPTPIAPFVTCDAGLIIQGLPFNETNQPFTADDGIQSTQGVNACDGKEGRWYTVVLDQDAIVKFDVVSQGGSGLLSPGIFSDTCEKLLCLETLRSEHIFYAEAGKRYFLLIPKEDTLILSQEPYTVSLMVSFAKSLRPSLWFC